MRRLTLAAPIAAMIYREGESDAADALLRRITDYLVKSGARLAGFVQRNPPREGQRRCDMVLVDLGSGTHIGIAEDRGPGARGCRLDIGELMRAMALAHRTLGADCDLLVVNRFGKTEANGGGVRSLIADALDRGIGVLIAVPERNVESWNAFAGDLAVAMPLAELPDEAGAACTGLGLTFLAESV